MGTDKNELGNKQAIVACFGSSTVASKGTFKWIDELEKRPQNKGLHFVNLGVGGDLAYNALQRLPDVVACDPGRVIVLVGANDVLSSVFKNVRRFFGGWKRLPKEPSPEWFYENLQDIACRLKQETSAKIALTSFQQFGEDPNSTHPVQRELNLRVEQYNNIIREIAEAEGVCYIPFYERLGEKIAASPGAAFTRFSFLSIYRDYLLREFILRYSFDEIAQMNGYRFHIDGIHLNTNGGMILTDLIQEFLDNAQ
jgi:lysophospholipase L1-like esterase